jgi:anionic cell wall polymer biosynthesis LytR-Cps2A-Psr (LCP) family protein
MRAQRQRKVLTALIDAYKNKSTGEMLILAKDILSSGFIQTDMTAEEVLDYISRLFPKLATTTINHLQIPADGTYTSMTVGNITATKVCDFEANRKLLEQVLQ